MEKHEEFESTKLSLQNAETAIDVKNNPVVKSTILSVLNSIPIIGELIDSSIDSCLSSFQEAKRQELIDLILSDVTITSDMVNDIEFIFNFAKTLEAVNRLSSNDKVKYFANLLKNGYFVSDKIQNDAFDEYLHLLSSLSFREIEYLWFLYKYQTEHFGASKDKGEYTRNFGVCFGETFNCGKFDYIDAYDKLSTSGCVQRFYKAYPPTITKVQDGYYEDYQASEIDIDIDYYYINDNFISFVKMITGEK